MSKDAHTVEVTLISGRAVDPKLLEEPLQAFTDHVTRLMQGESHRLKHIYLAFADAQPEVNPAGAIAPVGRPEPSDLELAQEARLARMRKLLADIEHGETDPDEIERKNRRD
jgi:hypothetical protein